MAVASFLIWNARFMGNLFDKYTALGYIVGGDNSNIEFDELKDADIALEQNGNDNNIELAANQNEMEDTSCGIYDDDDIGTEEEGQEPNEGVPQNEQQTRKPATE